MKCLLDRVHVLGLFLTPTLSGNYLDTTLPSHGNNFPFRHYHERIMSCQHSTIGTSTLCTMPAFTIPALNHAKLVAINWVGENIRNISCIKYGSASSVTYRLVMFLKCCIRFCHNLLSLHRFWENIWIKICNRLMKFFIFQYVLVKSSHLI